MKKLILLSSLIIGLTLGANFDASAQKKGISKQGKGAIIGGAGGAIAGGLIGHGVGGALIGGAIGAGGGYVIGNEATRREQKRKHQAFLERKARWRRLHPGQPYPY